MKRERKAKAMQSMKGGKWYERKGAASSDGGVGRDERGKNLIS